MWASMVASNLEVDVSRTIWHATSGSSPPLPLLATAASTFLAASMYFLPRFLGTRFAQSQRREGEQRRLPGRRPGRLCRRRDERKPAGFLSCFDHLEAHRTGGSLDHLHGGLDLVGVEVLALDLHDLPDLLPADPPDLLAVWLRGSFLDTGRALQQLDRRRGLENERKGAVLEDRDQRRHYVAGLLGGALVVGLGELHDVDAVRAERRADGRRGCGLAGRELELQDGTNLLLAH